MYRHTGLSFLWWCRSFFPILARAILALRWLFSRTPVKTRTFSGVWRFIQWSCHSVHPVFRWSRSWIGLMR